MARSLACVILLALPIGVLLAESKKAARPEPAITSIYPFSATRGTHFEAEIRGTALDRARALVFETAGITADVRRIEPASPEGTQVAHVELAIAGDATLGRHRFRVVTPAGVTNELRATVVDAPVLNGRIAHPGDVGTHWLNVVPGETLTIEAVSGYASFDPTITLWEETGSWFDPHRLTRIAFNDDPLSFPGLSTDARLAYRFTHAGKYCVQVGSFDGKAGPDYVYSLRISREPLPPPRLHPEINSTWHEREFTRLISDGWMQELSHRGGREDKPRAPELFHAVPENSEQIPTLTPPALVQGCIKQPGETHLIRVKIEKPQDVAIEVETPGATLPRFNPVVRLMQPDGYEIATDVYTKLNNNGLYMMKMIEAKTIFSLRWPGEYTMSIRDITTKCAGKDFIYRVLVRQQIPHVGEIKIAADHLNLERGSVKPIAIKIDREEGFSGYVLVNVRDLPAGVTALQALENPEQKPPLPNGGRAERYFAKDQTTSVVITASGDAPLTPMPVKARIEFSVVNDGKIGPVIESWHIPMMVVEPRP